MNGICVAYSGVHQTYQLALAAQEAGFLDRFFCSLFVAPGKWGGRLAQIFGRDALVNRACPGLPSEKVVENPWPLIKHRMRSGFQPSHASNWLPSNAAFDRWVVASLAKASSRVFVGVETCAEYSLRLARARGMKTIVDCPGIDADYLDDLAVRSAEEFGLTTRRSADHRAMRERKECERSLADLILLCSEVQRRSLMGKVIPEARTEVISLWLDPTFWFQAPEPRIRTDEPLRVLFAGKICIRKGVPYLLRAVVQCGCEVSLSLVGNLDEDVRLLLKPAENFRLLPPRRKRELRELYWQHDVLVLPSLGDSFGFVAMEAMACGLPVIVTENCGVPVPDESWRVPVMSSEAIAKRLLVYARDRDLCREHGTMAAEFARQFTPERYRAQLQTLFRRFLGETESTSGKSPV
jgi:glycosyltransferase involved in cell wall biosynthesis